MKQSVQGKRFVASYVLPGICALVMLFSASNLFAQSGPGGGSDPNSIPELIFKNPTLVPNTAADGKDGAVYKFAGVATGIDATVTITRRSSAAVVLSTIDESTLGWTKALQPTVGLQGNVTPGQTWWMEFEVKFFDAGGNNKKKIKNFKVTALDVDGDGSYIQEFVQMNKVTSVANSSITYLTNDLPLSLPDAVEDLTGYNLTGLDKRVTGPVTNFNNIDTTSTSVMSTFTYDNKDAFKFLIGGKSINGTSNAGMRLNSIWFKAFNLTPNVVLPVKLTDFSALLNKSDVSLSWTTASEENFSHYVIERSTDGSNYSDVALVFADGSATGSANYQYKDPQVSSATGVIYYRLRLMEKTNSYSYSPIRIIRLGKEAATLQITTYPNPVKSDVRVTLPSAWQGKSVSLELYSATGIRVQGVSIDRASQTESLQMSALPKGFYLVRAQCDGQVAEQKIIRQ
jgi:hypothetical protein